MASEDPAALLQMQDSARLRDALGRGTDPPEDLTGDFLAAFLAVDPPGGPASGTDPSRTDPSRTNPSRTGGSEGAWKHRLRARVLEDDGLRARYEEMVARKRSLEAGSDAAAHFERLRAGRTGPKRRGWWLGAAASLVLILGHGIWSTASEDPLRKAVWSTYRPAGVTRAPSAESELATARREAFASRRSLLGLWPSYDGASLEAAAAALGEWQAPAARLELARIQILSGRPVLARLTLAELPDRGPAGQEKALLLDLLARHGH